MFGKGVYFADCSSKSANYCYLNYNESSFMVLSEVSLGELNKLTSSNSYANKLPSGKHSVQGVGCVYPDPKDIIEMHVFL